MTEDKLIEQLNIKCCKHCKKPLNSIVSKYFISCENCYRDYLCKIDKKYINGEDEND